MVAASCSSDKHTLLLGVALMLQRCCSGDPDVVTKEKSCDPFPALAPPPAPAAPLDALALFNAILFFEQHARPSEGCYAYAVTLLNRAGWVMDSTSAMKQLCAALVVAIKVRDDLFYSNEAYATICGVSLSAANQAEKRFLHDLDWDVSVGVAEHAAMVASCYEEVRAVQGLVDVLPQHSTWFELHRGDGDGFGLLLKGTRVVGTVPHSAAWAAGLRRNAIIRSVGGRVVASQSEVQGLLTRAPEVVHVEVLLTTPSQGFAAAKMIAPYTVFQSSMRFQHLACKESW